MPGALPSNASELSTRMCDMSPSSVIDDRAGVTSFGSPWWYVRLLAGNPGRKVFRHAVQPLCARDVQTMWLALYSMDTSTEMGPLVSSEQYERVTGFLEKPQTDQEIDMVKMDPKWIDSRGIASGGRDCLASMGIYIFNKNTLMDVLTKTTYQDFGR